MDSNASVRQYLLEQIQRGVRDIYKAQRDIATQRIYRIGRARTRHQGSGVTVRGRSGILREALENPRYMFQNSGDGWAMQANLPVYIRFLDMKRHGNYRIYNRQIWGILYTETLQNIKYEYRDWLRKQIGRMLMQN